MHLLKVRPTDPMEVTDQTVVMVRMEVTDQTAAMVRMEVRGRMDHSHPMIFAVAIPGFALHPILPTAQMVRKEVVVLKPGDLHRTHPSRPPALVMNAQMVARSTVQR